MADPTNKGGKISTVEHFKTMETMTGPLLHWKPMEAIGTKVEVKDPIANKGGKWNIPAHIYWGILSLIFWVAVFQRASNDLELRKKPVIKSEYKEEEFAFPVLTVCPHDGSTVVWGDLANVECEFEDYDEPQGQMKGACSAGAWDKTGNTMGFPGANNCIVFNGGALSSGVAVKADVHQNHALWIKLGVANQTGAGWSMKGFIMFLSPMHPSQGDARTAWTEVYLQPGEIATVNIEKTTKKHLVCDDGEQTYKATDRGEVLTGTMPGIFSNKCPEKDGVADKRVVDQLYRMTPQTPMRPYNGKTAFIAAHIFGSLTGVHHKTDVDPWSMTTFLGMVMAWSGYMTLLFGKVFVDRTPGDKNGWSLTCATCCADDVEAGTKVENPMTEVETANQ